MRCYNIGIMILVLSPHKNHDSCVVRTCWTLNVCPKCIKHFMNGAPVARHRLILGEDEATTSRKLFKHLPGPPRPTSGQQRSQKTTINRSVGFSKTGYFVPACVWSGGAGRFRELFAYRRARLSVFLRKVTFGIRETLLFEEK